MKLNKIVALCKKMKQVVIYNRRREDGEIAEQWIGDGASCYRAEGMPILDSDSVGAIFDIPAKDAGKWRIHEMEMPIGYDFTDDAAENGEQIFGEDPIFLQYGGATLKPLRSQGGVPLFIDIRYLGPFINDMDHMYLYRRTAESGQDYVAVKVGMMLAGIIVPLKIEWRRFAADLKTLAEAVEQAAGAENVEARDE